MSKPLVRGFDWSQLRRLRVARNWSQDGLAAMLAVDRKLVSRWEHGACPGPSSRMRLFSAFPELRTLFAAHLMGVVGTPSGAGVPTTGEQTVPSKIS